MFDVDVELDEERKKGEEEEEEDGNNTKEEQLNDSPKGNHNYKFINLL